MNKEQVKIKIQDLVRKYEAVKANGKISKYTEEDTKKDFIIPLFEVLGWNVYERSEVTSEEQISGDRVDYGFYLNGRVKFYLEAKKLSVDLHKEEYAKQAIRYSWNKGVTWAVLTDFENLIVFNALSPEKSLAGKKYLSFAYKEYLTRLDELWRLSKEAFGEDILDKEAEKVGKKLQKVSVTETLSKDLNECREILAEAFSKWNEGIDPHLIDEGVQKLLNRLIFIRCAEDRKIEPPTLIPLIHEWKSSGKVGQVSPYQAMIKKFRELDITYNSNLFDEHPFEKWEEFGGATEKVIDILYGKKNYFEYDFSIIPADVLGNVYENYLGHQLKKSKKEEHLDKNLKRRKEQGIYYTPKFIVDYIVQNALGPVLDKCKSINDLQKIKILDPACGSGSFLVAAMNFLIKKYEEFNIKPTGLLKIQILQCNIYGVDLDQQAVELARLNLLLNTFDGQVKLPGLENNIKNGNSLISGTDEELKKYFGKNYRDKKPFSWQEEFPKVFKQGGFDVVIGNPPYIKEFVNKSAFDGLHGSPYYQGKMDLWTMFACVSIDLLRNGGTMSFIAPNNWVSNAGASIFRDKILNEGEIKSFIDFGDYKVFEEAGIQTMIYVFKKSKPQKKYSVEYLRIADKNITEEKLVADIFFGKKKIEIEPQNLIGKSITFEDSETSPILDKISKKKNFEILDSEISNGIHHHHDSVNRERQEILGSSFSVGDGIFVINDHEKEQIKPNKKELEIIKPSYTTKEFKRWYANPDNKEWVIYTDSSFKGSDKIGSYPNIKRHLDKFKAVITSDNKPYGLHRAKKEKFFKGEKIVTPRKCSNLSFSYVYFDSYVSATFYIIKTERVNQKYLTAILNSKITAFWLKNKGKMQGNNYQLDKEPLVGVPIYIDDKNQQKQIIILVDIILALNKELRKSTENSDQWHKIKDEIAKTDKKIDQKVYELYGLTEEERKVVGGK